MPDSDVAKAYITNLRGEIEVEVRSNPCRRKEWFKILKGDPVEIPPSYGNGYRVMTIDEWARDWKPNPDFKECAACGSTNTKEHHFIQTFCRGKKVWESESLCMDCYMFTWRSYRDPDFLTPEEYDKKYWMYQIEEAKLAREQKIARGEEPDLLE